ncbi:uncharacterized protein [Nicotiana tomentosiformis]|uniref:uncharacterized protein n=1 Tax=Nicotiana tomentosiformis TaxID=4098 RepID=UPI00388CCA7A
MAKIYKTVPQKEAASSSRTVGEKTVVEPRLEELVPEGRCLDVGYGSPSRELGQEPGLGKDAVMRPPSGDEEALPPISKSEKVIKRKRASDSEGQKPRKRAARKPKVNVISLTMESVLSLREEEEESDSGLVAHARASTDTQDTSVSVGVDTAPSKHDEVEKETLTQVPEPRRTEDILPRGKETIEETVDAGVRTELEAPQDGKGAQKDLLGAIECGDSPFFPSFSQSMIRDAQAVETGHGDGAHGEEDPFRCYFIEVEYVTVLSDLEASKKSSSEVGVPCLFNEAQQALNRDFVLHHEVFLQSQGELSRYEAEVQRLNKERDAFKLLNKQRKGELKGFRAELEASRKEQTEMVEQVKRIFEFNDIDLGVIDNSSVPQVEQKFNVIRQFHVEVDVVKSEAEEWKKNTDHLASKKETVRTQMASAEAQLRSLKEKSLVQAEKIEEFQSRLSSANSDRERSSNGQC